MDDTESCNSSSSSSSSRRSEESIRRRRLKVEVFQEVVRRLREANVEEAKGSGFEDELWDHFSSLPLRYALDVNIERPENIIMHKKMLHVAHDTRVAFELRLVEIRPIYDAPPDDHVSPNYENTASSTSFGSLYPPPAFGKSAASAFEANNIYNEDGDTSVRGNSLLVRYSARPLHEITISMKDKPKLLSKLTRLLSEISLNIQEAHAFSTIDGYSLDVFIVDGWPYERTDQLKDVLVEEIPKIEKQCEPAQKLEFSGEELLHSGGCKLIPEHEDNPTARNNNFWEIDFNLLTFLNKESTWSNCDLFKGMLGSQDVAIKSIRAECLNEDVKKEFAQEVSILSQIQHENIVRFIGACSRLPFLCIITEFVSGGSVYDLLHKDKSKLALPAIVKIGIDVSNGMCYLHENKIIHRDLKAANLLIDDNGVVKISDFGVARVQVEEGIMTAETGTYRWMAPEVIKHMPYDQKADVFSFGILLWELLTGELPYAHLTPLQAAVGVIQKDLRPSVPVGTHPTLTQLLERCWQKQPSSRPEFSEIEEILQQLAKEVGKEDKSEKIGKRRRDAQ